MNTCHVLLLAAAFLALGEHSSESGRSGESCRRWFILKEVSSEKLMGICVFSPFSPATLTTEPFSRHFFASSHSPFASGTVSAHWYNVCLFTFRSHSLELIRVVRALRCAYYYYKTFQLYFRAHFRLDGSFSLSHIFDSGGIDRWCCSTVPCMSYKLLIFHLHWICNVQWMFWEVLRKNSCFLHASRLFFHEKVLEAMDGKKTLSFIHNTLFADIPWQAS